MKPPLYSRIALRADVPAHGLRTGDVGCVVDYVPHPSSGEEGCLIEMFNALGESIAVIALPVSIIEPLRADEIFSVRQLVHSVS
jgi:hypothetical protein